MKLNEVAWYKTAFFAIYSCEKVLLKQLSQWFLTFFLTRLP